MIVMCQFDKGIFTPVSEGEGEFAEVRHKAFEGSDYQEELYREHDEDSIPLSGVPTSLMGGYGFTGENKASAVEEASDLFDDLFERYAVSCSLERDYVSERQSVSGGTIWILRIVLSMSIIQFRSIEMSTGSVRFTFLFQRQRLDAVSYR